MKASVLLMLAALPLVISVDARGEDPVLAVHFDSARHLDGEAKARVQALAMGFVESSNFNSVKHREMYKSTPSKVHAAYRKAVAGRYMVVTFESPRPVKTLGGEVEVLEAVIGLNGQLHANSLFTIDGEGRVVNHEKYSGALGIELLEAIKKLPPEG